MRRAAKRDHTEQPIRAALHAAGARTWAISTAGLPDLLIFSPGGAWLVAEVKNKQGRNRPTRRQTAQAAPWPTIRTPQEALDLLKGSKA